jgi:hypothetical protein
MFCSRYLPIFKKNDSFRFIFLPIIGIIVRLFSLWLFFLPNLHYISIYIYMWPICSRWGRDAGPLGKGFRHHRPARALHPSAGVCDRSSPMEPPTTPGARSPLPQPSSGSVPTRRGHLLLSPPARGPIPRLHGLRCALLPFPIRSIPPGCPSPHPGLQVSRPLECNPVHRMWTPSLYPRCPTMSSL